MARATTEERRPGVAVPSGRSTTVAAAAAALVIGAATILTYARLYFGVDLTDESFYAAVPYRFVLGARPLVDETNVAQLTAGVLLYPFVKAYSAVAGLAGLILFLRHLHLAFSLGVGFAVFHALRRPLRDAPTAAVAAAIPVAFVPFGIHALSYNTLASGFFLVGCVGGGLATDDRRVVGLSGAAHGLAVFVYPPFALPVVAFFAALWLASRPLPGRTALAYLLPLTAGVLATAAFFLQDGVDTARMLFDRASTYSGQGGGLGKAWDVASAVVRGFPHPYAAVVLLGAAAALGRWRSSLRAVPLLALPFTALPGDLRTSAASNAFVTSFALLAPGVFVLAARDPLARRLMLVIWAPSALAGLVTGVSSANGSINVAIGFLPGAIVTTTLIVLVVGNGVPPDRFVAGALVRLAPAAAAVGIGVALQYAFVYRDAPVSRLTSRVDHGAWAGIATTPRTKNFLTRLERDLDAASGHACGIVFYDAFPAGYLLDRGRPDTNTALLLDVAPERRASYERLLLAYWARQDRLPDVAVRLDEIPLSDSSAAVQTYGRTEPLERLFGSARYATVDRRPEYVIRKRGGAHCQRADGE